MDEEKKTSITLKDQLQAMVQKRFDEALQSKIRETTECLQYWAKEGHSTGVMELEEGEDLDTIKALIAYLREEGITAKLVEKKDGDDEVCGEIYLDWTKKPKKKGWF